MATITINDASGTPTVVGKYLPGRTTAVESLPSVLCTEDKAVLDAINAKLATLGPKGVAGSAPMVQAPFEPGTTTSYVTSTTPIAAVACTAGTTIRFSAEAGAIIGISFGTSTIAASIQYNTSMTITAPETFTVPVGTTHWSAVMSSGSGTLKATTGAGA